MGLGHGDHWHVDLTPDDVLDDCAPGTEFDYPTKSPATIRQRAGRGNPDAIPPGGYRAPIGVERDQDDERHIDPRRIRTDAANHFEDRVVAAYDAIRADERLRIELGADLCDLIDDQMDAADDHYRDQCIEIARDAIGLLTPTQQAALSLHHEARLGSTHAGRLQGVSKQAMNDRRKSAHIAMRGIIANTELMRERSFTFAHRVERQCSSPPMTLNERGSRKMGPFYTIPQVEAAGQISVPTLYRRWAEGAGPASVRQGGKRLVTAAALNDWLAQLPGG